MTFEQTITDMGILSNEVYNDNYFEYKIVDGKKVYANAFITTANGTYTIIDSEDTLNSMQALLLKDPNGKFVIAFPSFPSSSLGMHMKTEPRFLFLPDITGNVEGV